MDVTERQVFEYLSSKGFKNIAYEPDGNVPPDFLVDGRIAVEVRRLNEHDDFETDPRGLEEVAIPLNAKFLRLLASFGPPTDGAAGLCPTAFDARYARGRNSNRICGSPSKTSFGVTTNDGC